jgi:hypothetical protein
LQFSMYRLSEEIRHVTRHNFYAQAAEYRAQIALFCVIFNPVVFFRM